MKSKHKAILYILSAALFFSLMNTFVRLAGDLPFIQKSFFRNLIAFFCAAAVMKKEHISPKWKEGSLKGLLMRSSFGLAGILCNFYAVDHIPIADASMLNKLSPFFAILFSLIFLGERVTIVQWLLAMGAFAGSLLIIKPSMTNTDFFPALIGLFGGMGAGAAYTAVRWLSGKGVKGPYVVFFFSAFSCIVTAPALIFDYHPMTVYQLAMLLLAGGSAAAAQFSITAAYFNAPAKEISVFDYSQVIFSAIIGMIVFDQLPDIYSFLGYIVICLMAVIMFFYNNRNVGKAD